MKKSAIVTGGASGIGRAICIALAQQGFDVLIVCRKASAALHEVEEACRTYGVKAYSSLVDLSDAEAVKEIVETHNRIFGQTLDVLVNNAAETASGSFGQLAPAQIEKAVNVNLLAPIQLTHQLMPSLKNARGNVINISSINATHPVRGLSVYCATKAGMETFTRSLAIDAGPDGVRVNCVSPGCTNTPMFSNATTPEIRTHIASETPLQRIGEPEDIANVVCLLLSEKAKWITGETITASGGLY
ncbi:SDR family NAD(P)-dependent oxidoreductase [Alteromonas oceanisediminis]|uniref:SDR family NAD(P)-dependent oxidoreductase n=1 Tax=Alteromonas oceanisediminis TaxID=2836180 RepID=UPI001BDA62DC|nr:SDR family oxidoreductase [Alteromonas oceanisediminis]MBT0587066.1 SDR family oxidoreductase [Alteromonas oceanisediminis]